MTAAIARRRKEIGLERRERTRQRLLEAAARVVAHLGEDEATIDHFISEAEVARGTFYNYFPTRDDLITALWSYVGQDPFRAIQKISAAAADPAERLVMEARLVLARAAQDATWGWLLWYMSRSAESLNEDLRAYPLPDLLAGRASGRFRFGDPEAARDLVVGTIRAAMRTVLTNTPRPDYAEHLSTMLLMALGISATEAARVAARPLPEPEGKAPGSKASVVAARKVGRQQASDPRAPANRGAKTRRTPRRIARFEG